MEQTIRPEGKMPRNADRVGATTQAVVMSHEDVEVMQVRETGAPEEGR